MSRLFEVAQKNDLGAKDGRAQVSTLTISFGGGFGDKAKRVVLQVQVESK